MDILSVWEYKTNEVAQQKPYERHKRRVKKMLTSKDFSGHIFGSKTVHGGILGAVRFQSGSTARRIWTWGG
jgi:hypothetical protein